MPLESASYISQLNSANPAATDLLSQGDDHIRLIKAVLQATFPNINGPVTATDEQINSVVGAMLGVPVGTICIWYGQSTNVPAGWGICNGTTYTKVAGGTIVSPDLRDRVVMGAGAVAAQNTNFGAANASATSGAGGAHTHAITGTGAHTHAPTVQGHALTISEMPAHTHTVPSGHTDTAGQLESNSGGTGTNTTTSSTGSGAAHTHGITFPGTDGTHTHTLDTSAAHTHGVTVSTYQPAQALHYIIKL